jgi:hypothetical protein
MSRRKRGGQLGNQNARKHSVYALNLTPSETVEYLNLVNLQGFDKETAAIRIKLKSIMTKNPDNRRAVSRIIKMFANWTISRYDLGREEAAEVRKQLRSRLLKPARSSDSNCHPLDFSFFAETNRRIEAASPVFKASDDKTNKPVGSKTPKQIDLNE